MIWIGRYQHSHSFQIESMSAPEDCGDPNYPLYPRVLVSDSEARDTCPPLEGHMPPVISSGMIDNSRSLLAPRTIRSSSSGRRKLDNTFRTDSLSSDQSECLSSRPPPPKPHKVKKHGHAPHRGSGRPFGVSSSDEEIRSTPECTSCGEEEMESESVSEKGKPNKIHIGLFGWRWEGSSLTNQSRKICDQTMHCVQCQITISILCPILLWEF